MTLRRAPRCCRRSASPQTLGDATPGPKTLGDATPRAKKPGGAIPRAKTLRDATPRLHTPGDATPSPRAGNGGLPGGGGDHEGPPPCRAPRRAAVGAAREPPRRRPGAKRRKPYTRKPKTPGPSPGPPAGPQREEDGSPALPEGLSERGPPPPPGDPRPDSSLDSSVVSPLRRLRPVDPQSPPPAKVSRRRVGACAQRTKSQTTSTPRQGGSGIQPVNSPPGSRPSSPLDQLSQHESQLSSDLSIEFSLPEDELINISFEGVEEEEEEDEEDELPSFLTQLSKKPASIKEGDFVWCKFRLFPFWPAVVKSVKPKLKKASIIWIDQPTIDKKRNGFSVSLRNLKPFDCEETNQLVCAAKANYAAVIDWALELINDYVFRIACSSFTGSFIEYSSHFMSNPVRRKYPEGGVAGLALPSRLELEGGGQHSGGEESVSEALEEGGPGAKRLLPDRTVAAHNRANEKLVTFIVSQRLADQHLLAVIRGQQASRWLRSFLKASRRLQVKNYLEDDGQLDQVYVYLKELFDRVTDHAPCLANVRFMDDVRFVLDVLLPEAIISAIAGVDNISLNKAEEKYLNGRCISEREREEFELTIGQQMNSVS